MSKVVRDDLSDCLIHLTKGDLEKEAFPNFLSIIHDRALKGGTGFIKGKHTCVCFSEAPVSKLGHLLATTVKVDSATSFKYKPYGVMFKKRWIYKEGGRPVIYQEDADYDLLHPEKKHLHVRFYLSDAYDVDHTWEREWRVKTDILPFTPKDVTLIVPQRAVIDVLKENHHSEQTKLTAADPSRVYEPFPWHCIALEDLGVNINLGG